MSQTIVVDADPRRRSVAFLQAWLDTPEGADIEFRLGKTETGTPAVVVSISGVQWGFTASEARVVADIAESTMRAFPRETTSMADLILGLRMCADRAER